MIPGLIVEKFGDEPVGRSGNDLIYHCPECENRKGTPDTTGNLYVHTKTLVYHCFRCEWTGKINEDSGKGYTFTKYNDPSSDKLAGSIKSALGMVVDDTNIVNFDYEIPSQSVMVNSIAYGYLRKRNISDEMINYYNMRFADFNFSDKRLSNRIVIPNRVIMKNGKFYTDMYVARSLITVKDKPKYLNPYKNKKSRIVFNLHRISPGSPIIITEGVMSCISAGPYAVATYGKAISDRQLSLIVNNNPSAIYVSLDPDALDYAYKTCSRLKVMTDAPVYLVRMPDGKDPNDLGTELFYQYVKNAEVYDDVLVKLEKANK